MLKRKYYFKVRKTVLVGTNSSKKNELSLIRV